MSDKHMVEVSYIETKLMAFSNNIPQPVSGFFVHSIPVECVKNVETRLRKKKPKNKNSIKDPIHIR